MNDCHKTRDLFSLVHENEASRQEMRYFESHLSECPPCREEWGGFRSMQSLVTTLPRIGITPDFEERVLMAVRTAQRDERLLPLLEQPSDEPRWWEGWIPRFALAGAAAALVVMVMLPTVGQNVKSQSLATRMISQPTVQPVVQRLEDRFPDLPPEVLRSLDEESYVLDKMTVQPATSRGRARVVAPVVDESHGPVYVTF